jgi:hypothetical protein
MPNIRTGETVHEIVASFTFNNVPVSAATFSTTVFRDGVVVPTGITVSSTLSDPVRAIFDFSWSANTLGTYQVNIYNNTTNVTYISDIYQVQLDSFFDTTVYVGL